MTPDVIVVGGGVVGCAIALRLREKGASVLVLERSVPGAEASSAAAGMIAPQSEADEATESFDLALRSARLHASLAEELRARTGIDVGYRKLGTLFAAFDEEELARARKRVEWQAARGLSAEVVSRDGARELEPALSTEIQGGAFFADEAQVDSPLFARALSQAAAIAGATFLCGVPVRRIVTERGRVAGVETQDGLQRAATVVVAAGSWSSLVEGTGLPADGVRPARGQIVQLETRPPLLRRVLLSGRGYVVPRADGRVICGSTIENVGFEKAVTAEGVVRILSAALELAPALASAPLTASWSGFRPVTAQGRPLVGRGEIEGLFFATGHFTSGILLAPVTAELIAGLWERPAT